MINSIIILSDIHGNLSALEAVFSDICNRQYKPDALAILGDNINYGMRPNEIIKSMKKITETHNVIVNLFGNHEKALIDRDLSHFSTERGKQILDYTRSIITDDSLSYIKNLVKEGFSELEINGRKFLFVHGSLSDPYWGKINLETIESDKYSEYDFVISGHSHIPHMIEYFYQSGNKEYRNKKRVVFLNPGSVGQPRNHNPRAQYLYLELKSEVMHFNSVEYDVRLEQSFYNNNIDMFYANRLKNGI